MLPPFVGLAVGRMLLSGMRGGNLPALIAFGLINLAMTAGLLAMIRATYAGEGGGWDAFLIGVGRHFAPLLAGTLVMLLLALSTLYPVLLALQSFAGLPDAPLLQKALSSGVTLPLAQMQIVERWAAGIGIWAVAWGLLLFFLLVWKQAVVVDAVPWTRAWRSSFSFVRRHWGKLGALLVAEGLALALGLTLSTLSIGAISELGALVSFLANAYFTVALTIAFMGPQPKGAELDASA